MRIDKPTLMCDRCQHTTDDLTDMSRYNTLLHDTMSGSRKWDLCPVCWADFCDFMTPA